MLREADTTRSLIKRIRPFWPCNEKKETRTSCDSLNGSRKTQQGILERQDVGWTNKWLNVGRVTEALKVTRDQYAWRAMIAKQRNICSFNFMNKKYEEAAGPST